MSLSFSCEHNSKSYFLGTCVSQYEFYVIGVIVLSLLLTGLILLLKYLTYRSKVLSKDKSSKIKDH